MRSRALWAWTAIAMWAPLVHFSGGSWPALILLGVICYAVMKLLPENQEALQNNKLYCILQLIGIYLLLSQLMPMSALYWPGKLSEKVIPTVLLILGAYSCMKKPERVAGILFWAMLLLFFPVILAGIRDVKLEWTVPTHFGLSLYVVPMMLLPMLTSFVSDEGIQLKWYKWIIFAAAAMWMITSGLLSADAAKELETPFRNVSMSLSLGTYSRFESIVASALTFGWYGFASLLLHAAARCMVGLKIKKETGIWIFLILVLTNQLIDVKISPEITTIYMVFSWILFPAFGCKKISKKSEKST